MIKVIQMSLEEFAFQAKRTDWRENSLPVGEIYVDKSPSGKWVAVEIIAWNNGNADVKTYPLQIV